ncbi:MAG: NAD(P)H-hydrate dehydratase [Carboxydocellales bacterium]
MYIATTEEMRKLDRTAIESLGIPGVVLMENAGLQVVEVIARVLGELKDKKITIMAGKGNNGGDGFVIARHLLNRGAEVKTLLFANIEEISGDAKVNLEILQKLGHKIYPAVNTNSLNIVRVALVYTDLIVDAIYGTGFKGELSEHVGRVVEVVNESKKPVVSVDIPSGVAGDTGKVNGSCIHATHTVTFALPKLGNILQPGADYGGKLHTVDISIPQQLVNNLGLKCQLITGEMVRSMLPKRHSTTHKGSYGRVAVIAGSEGLTGAAALASMAALRTGAGLVTLGIPRGLHDLMEIKLTEVMTTPLPDTGRKTLGVEAQEPIRQMCATAQVLAIGPGLGQDGATMELVQNLLPQIPIPMVIDADALNALAQKTELIKQIPGPAVLTPHSGEMARLLGVSRTEIQEDRLKTAQAAAQDWKAVVVLKGAKTIVACPDGRTYINSTGNPGLATGGTGDVLTGVIAALIAQGLKPEEAAAAGVYLHGLAGDYLQGQLGMLGMVAGDLLEALPIVTQEYD